MMAVRSSVQTVYFQFRTKNELLRAVHEWTVLGDEGLTPGMQPWYRAALEAPNASTLLREIVTGTADINARIAPTLPIFATLAREPAGQIYRESRRLRREGMEHLVSLLQVRNALRDDLNPRRAADILDFLIGPEAYAQLVINSGWATSDWIAWTARSLDEQILSSP